MLRLQPKLDLSLRSVIVRDGTHWSVVKLEPQYSRVTLQSADGEVRLAHVRDLLNDPRCRQSSRSSPLPADRGRQPADFDDLTPRQRDLTLLRVAHINELRTGYRSGDPLQALEGEPKAEYDPAVTPSLEARRRAKEAELERLDRLNTSLLGLQKASFRTLKRREKLLDERGIMGCADNRWLRERCGHYRLDERVREAIYAAYEESLVRSKVSMETKFLWVHQYLAETAEPGAAPVKVPSNSTLRGLWKEWFGPGGSRQRYAVSAAALEGHMSPERKQHVVVYRPGQVVALDTTPVPVMVIDPISREPVRARLTWALDVYTRSLVAFRLTLSSEKSVDVAMVLRDMTMPLPMRPGWDDDMEWPYPGVPAHLVAQFAGHKVAGLPFFTPETVTTDHGGPYRSHDLVRALDVLKCNILPARVLRPTDKQAVERAFKSAQSLLFEALPGYTGADVADRGIDPEGDAALTIQQLEHLIATWIVKDWQNRRLGSYAPSWDPMGDQSPNTLFAASMAQGGFAMEIPEPETFYRLLPSSNTQIQKGRGVKVKKLYYWGPILDHLDLPRRGGRHGRKKWRIRYDPRDRRTVFFQDPDTHAWHELRWTGLPASGHIPAFNDARVDQMLKLAKTRGVVPKTDAELRPLLLEMLKTHAPVSEWRSQLKKKEKLARSREIHQGAAAAADRPVPTRPSPLEADGLELHPASARRAPAVEQSWEEQDQLVQDSLDAERALRRQRAVAPQPVAPGTRLGGSEKRNLFLIPDEEWLEGETEEAS
ncbi:Mu transposase C-terminal domain-containing protein [Actinoplanes sp. NPDC024001]|uniref:Mu transposase C-terminal domain-containing protein n=1 Tax=Actinoplanes sp. NPDC024001 TaxID=3154598 RepID=UPI003410C543